MIDIIANPIAGGVKGKKIRRAILKVQARLNELKKEFTFHYTNKKNHAKELTKQLIDNGATDIVVMGGDGTLHEVINGFSNFDKVNLGLIPCGTGNDFAASVKIPTDPVKAIDIIANGEAKYTDFMQMPTVRGINIIGMGIDVDVLKRYSKAKRKTKLTYTLCLVKTLLKFDYYDFDVEMNGKTTHQCSFIACIANGYRYGGGIPICPVADATDNELDFVAIKEIPKLKIIKAFLKLKKGKILTLKETVHEKADKIKITPTGEYTVNVDGELYENIPFEIKVVPNTLKMYRP